MPFSASSNITAHPYSDINYSNIFFIYFVYLIKLSLTFIRRLPLLLYPKSLITAFTYLPFISSSASQFSQTVDFRLTPLFTIELLLRLSLVFSASRCFQSFDIPLLSVNSPRASASCFLFLLSNKYLPPSSLLIHGFKLSPWPSNLAITYLVEDMFTSMHFVLRSSFSNITLSFCLYTVSSQFFSVFAFLSVHAFISFLALAVLYVLALYL